MFDVSSSTLDVRAPTCRGDIMRNDRDRFVGELHFPSRDRA